MHGASGFLMVVLHMDNCNDTIACGFKNRKELHEMKRDIGETFVDSIRLISENGSGNMNNLLRPRLMKYNDDEQTSTIRYEISDWELNQRGQVHGGAVSAMFDVSMGVSASVFCNRDVTTAEMSISYIRPFIGEVFDFRTEVLYCGKKLVRLECRAYNCESGKLTASAHATFAYIGQIVTNQE